MTVPMQGGGGHEIAAAKERIEELRREVQKTYIGSARALEMMMVSLLARGHVLLEGVPGVAKTTLVKAFATALGCSARRIQFTPDLLPADITGTYVLSPKDGTFSLRAGPIFANVVLADEINRAPRRRSPRSSRPCRSVRSRSKAIARASSPFLVLATQNPIDLEGTYPLPEAQIDRFLVRVVMGYPSAREESLMLRTHGIDPPALRAVLNPTDVAALQAITARIHVDDDLHDYAVSLTTYTRAHPKVALGASPRATLGLMSAGKAHAVLAGRNYVVPEDLRAVAVAVLAHRLVLIADVEGDARVREAIIEEALSKVGYRRGFRAV